MSIKRFYRKEPVVSTIVTAGTVNVLMGVLEGQAMLAFLGVLVVSGTIALRGWHKYVVPAAMPERSPIRYLPDQTSQSPMPIIGLSSRRDSDTSSR